MENFGEYNKDAIISHLEMDISDIKSRKSALEKSNIELEDSLELLKRKEDDLKDELVDDISTDINYFIDKINEDDLNFIEYLRLSDLSYYKSRINDFNKVFEDKKPLNMVEFSKIAKSRGFTITDEFLSFLSKLLEDNIYTLFPLYVLNFINSYLNEIKTDIVLDPWADCSSILISLANNLPSSDITGILSSKNMDEFVIEFYKNLKIHWELHGMESDILNRLRAENNQFDLVIGFPPSIEKTDSYSDFSKQVIDDFDKIQLFKASMLLDNEGVGIFFINNDFLYLEKENGVLENLEKNGLYLEAVLNLPELSLKEAMSDSLLVIVRKKEFKDVFIGDLTRNEDMNTVLLENLKSRKSGKIPQKGTLINDIRSFYSFKKYYGEIESRNIAKRLGLSIVPLSEITSEIQYLDKENVLADINSIYLPIIENIPAVSTSEKIESEKEYIQLVLKLDKVNYEYLVNFYNSELGKKVRNSLEIGKTVPKLNKNVLMKSEVYIPDLDTQNEVLELDSSINDILTQLNIDKRSLWKYPRRTKKIRENIELLNRGFTLEDWMKTLPFPLASILWSYEIELNSHLKFKYLLRFFEAYSEFNLAFILSALTQDMNFYRDHFKKCMHDSHDWYDKPSFGNWNYVGECMAKQVRKVLEGPHKQHCLDLFGNPDNDLLRVIISKDLYNILRKARIMRNKWEAHDTPSIPNEEYDKRIELLLEELYGLKSLTSNLYDSILFFIAITGGCTRDGCSFEVKELKGTMTSFKKSVLETSENVFLSEIYFINENQLKPVCMLPFVKIRESPHQEQDACYFYNRIEEGEVRLVTYHFKKKFEDLIPEEEFKLLDLLKSL